MGKTKAFWFREKDHGLRHGGVDAHAGHCAG